MRSAGARHQPTVLGADDEQAVGVAHDVAAAAVRDQPHDQREEQSAAAGDQGGDQGVEEPSGFLGAPGAGAVRAAVGQVNDDGLWSAVLGAVDLDGGAVGDGVRDDLRALLLGVERGG